jgi:hypothetical protein
MSAEQGASAIPARWRAFSRTGSRTFSEEKQTVLVLQGLDRRWKIVERERGKSAAAGGNTLAHLFRAQTIVETLGLVQRP